MKNISTLILCFLLSTTVHAIHVERLTVEQNLSNNETFNIAQDINGGMWFLSEEGVNTFFGGKFMTPDNMKSWVRDSLHNQVTFIETSSFKPYLYMANTKCGLLCYNVETMQFEDTPITTYCRTNKITNITCVLSEDEFMWFVAPRQGVYRYNQYTGEIRAYDKTTIPEFSQMGLNTIGVKKEMVYLGTWTDGFATLDTRTLTLTRYTTESTQNNLVDDGIRAIEVMRNGLVWVGSANGLSLFTENEETPFVYYSSPENAHGIPDKKVFDITQLKDGSLMVGVELQGIYVLTPQKMLRHGPRLSFEKLENDFSSLNFSEFSVREIFQDTFDNIWVSTYGGGVGFIGHEPPVFECLTRIADGTSALSLSHPVAWGVCTDDNNRLWVGTDGKGIDVFQKGRKIANLNHGVADGSGLSVLCATNDKQGHLWFGTYQHGLFQADPSTMKLKPVMYNQSKIKDIRNVTTDPYNNLWTASIEGLFKLDLSRGDMVHYTMENAKLKSNHIRSAFVDSRGYLWVGHYLDGIQVFKMDTMEEILISAVNDLKDIHIRNIIEDSKHQIWIASDRGLTRVNIDHKDANIRFYTDQDGLISNNVQAIIEYPKGVIWGSTTRGLIRVDLSDESFSCYTESNLKKLHSFRKNSVAHDNSRLYFGSSDGLWSFNPNKIRRLQEAPSPVVTVCHQLGDTDNHFYLGQNEYTHPASLTRRLPGLEVKFVSQDYAYHNRLTYQYQLKGGDEQWYDLGREQRLTLRNILPGKYTLKIRSVLDGDMNSASTTNLQLNITPPFWLAWWFLLPAFIILVIIIWAGFRYYVKQLELRQMFELEKQAHTHENELNVERLRYFTDITHEIRTPLTLILGPLRDLLENVEFSVMVKKELQVIYRSAKRLLNLTNMLIMFRKLENNKLIVVPRLGDLSAFCESQINDFRVLNRNKHVEVFYKCQEAMNPIYFDSEVMTIVLTNLLSNALKHTHEGVVSLEISQDENTDQTILRVTDTGKGISKNNLDHIFQRWYSTDEPSSTFSNGIGLSIVSELVDKHEGMIDVKSQEGEGTVFTVYLRSSNQYEKLNVKTDESTPQVFVVEEQSHDDAVSALMSEPLKTLKPKMLVVEDDLEIQEYITRIFEDTYSVLVADNGEAALDLINAHNVQVIISDYMMPVMDGIELCKQVKESEKYAHIPFIILTAISDNQQRELGYEVGANSFLTKPFSANLLKSRVNNLVLGMAQSNEAKSIQTTLDKQIILRNNLSHIEQEFVENLNSLIEENLCLSKVDVNFLADNLNMSNSTLYRKMKQVTGLSANEYIRYIRLKKAEMFLLQGQYTIAEITDLVGLNTPGYFRKCFKEAFGVSPTEYVKKVMRQQ